MEGTMSGARNTGPKEPTKISRAEDRKGRQRAALKANMARRKAQARARSSDDVASDPGPDNVKE